MVTTHANAHRYRAGAVRIMMILLAILLASFSILTTSRAVFTDTTDNTGNDFAAGTVAIVDDDTGSVLFSIGNFAPGDSFENCIEVTYNGTLDADVRLYGANLATTTALNLAPQLNLTIEEGTGSGFRVQRHRARRQRGRLHGIRRRLDSDRGRRDAR